MRMILEFVPGGDLYHFLYADPQPQVPYSLALKMCLDISAGMRFLISVSPPIIHRDLRSPNIFVQQITSELGAVCLQVADFGLSRKVAGPVSGLLRTWQWLAPEVCGRRAQGRPCSANIQGL